MTGAKCEEVDTRLRNAGIPRYIEKPSTARELAMSIESEFSNGYDKPMLGVLDFSIGKPDGTSQAPGGP